MYAKNKGGFKLETQIQKNPRTPVIDFHVHLADYQWWSTSTFEWLLEVNPPFEELQKIYKYPDNFVKFIKECGIDYAVILAEISPITTGVCTNEQVEEFCKGYNNLIPFGCINIYMETNPAKKLEELIIKRGFKGLKLYPTYQYFYPNDHKLYPLYAVAQELGIPIMFHTGSSVFKGARIKYGDPLYFDDVAVDFPDLQILMVHSGRGFWYDRAFFLARLHPNLYMELAGLPPGRLFSYFPEFERNADKIIFASDWPGVPDLKKNIQDIKKLPISEASKEKILGGNAARILKLPDKI